MYSNQIAPIIYQEGLPNQAPLGQMNSSCQSTNQLSVYPSRRAFQPIQQTNQPVSTVVYVSDHGRSIFYPNRATVTPIDSRRNGRPLFQHEVQGVYSSYTFPRLSEVKGHDISPVGTYSGSPMSKSGYNIQRDFTLPTVNYQNHPVPTQGQQGQIRQIVFPLINHTTLRRESSPSVLPDQGSTQATKPVTNQTPANAGKAKRQAVKLPPGCTGLMNLGNTCYMNSVLQCLSHTKVLVEYCFDQKNKSKTTRGNLSHALADVFRHMWSGVKLFDPTEFRKRMLATITGFDDDACQEDAQEFLLFLLGSLHNDLKKKKKKDNRSKHISIRLFPQCDEVADCAWSKYLCAENGVVVDIFMGQQRSSLTCSSCNHVSHTFEPAQGLSLAIPKTQNGTTVTLLECLRHYFHKETLGGEEKPACNNCNNKSDATKCLSMQKFPKIFVIQLSRFSSNPEGTTKITTPVHYPIHNLNFKQFSYVNANVIYNLYAVVEHIGKLDNGHYMATIRNRINGNWYHYDDDIVTQVPESHAVCQSAYMLFYELFSAEVEKPERDDSVSNLNLKNLFIDKSIN